MNVSTTASLLPVLSSALDTAITRRTAAWKRDRKTASAVTRTENQVARWTAASREDLRDRAAARLAAARDEHQEAREDFLRLCSEHISLARSWELVAATLAPPLTTAAAIAAHLTAPSYDLGIAHVRRAGLPEYETGRPATWDREYAVGAVARHAGHGAYVWLDHAGAVRVAWSASRGPIQPGGPFLSLIPLW